MGEYITKNNSTKTINKSLCSIFSSLLIHSRSLKIIINVKIVYKVILIFLIKNFFLLLLITVHSLIIKNIIENNKPILVLNFDPKVTIILN